MSNSAPARPLPGALAPAPGAPMSRTSTASRARLRSRPGLGLALAVGLALVGCGYRWVGPGDAPALRLGSIDDLTPAGDLGSSAREHLRRRVRPDADAGLELRGLVRGGADEPVALTSAGERVRAVGVVVELSVVDRDGRPVAVSGPVARSRPAMLSAEPAAADRRRALDLALADALDDALERLVARLPAGDAP